MAKLGGHGVFPLRLGSAKPRSKIVLDGLLAARGTAYDVTNTTTVFAEDMAVARGVSFVWDVNELLGHQFNPTKLSILLPRWERILGLPVSPSATLHERRTTVAALISRAGATPWYQEIVDRLTALLSPITFSIVHNTAGGAGVISSWPGGWYVTSVGTTPPTVTLTGHPAATYGLQIQIDGAGALGVATFKWSSDGGLSFSTSTLTAASVALGSTGLTAAFAAGTYALNNQYMSNPTPNGFSSAVGNIIIVTVKPSWMSELDYYDRRKALYPLLDAFLPAWIGFNVVRDGSVAGSFILDEVGNLDNQRLS